MKRHTHETIILGADVNDGDPLQRNVLCLQCHTLSTVEEILAENYNCPGCFDLVCLHCGCTNEKPCLAGCTWIGLGICSSHITEITNAIADTFGPAIVVFTA